jgi:hypothetical protein
LKPSVVKPWTGDNRTAYARVDDLDRIAEGFKRCRATQYFIASPDALANVAEPVTCPCCAKPVEPGDSNRGHYYPKVKRYAVMHYACAWGALLNDISKLRVA